MTVDEARQVIGRYVIYKPWPEAPPERWERGVITSVSTTLVFVRYGGDQHSKGTSPRDLELAFFATDANGEE